MQTFLAEIPVILSCFDCQVEVNKEVYLCSLLFQDPRTDFIDLPWRKYQWEGENPPLYGGLCKRYGIPPK